MDQPAHEVIRKIYTPETMAISLMDGYILVPRELWPKLSKNTRIKYVLRCTDTADENTPACSRFRGGKAYVGCHMSFEDNPARMKIGTALFEKSPGYFSYWLDYDRIDVLWKQFTPPAAIELHMICESLRDIRGEIADIRRRLES